MKKVLIELIIVEEKDFPTDDPIFPLVNPTVGWKITYDEKTTGNLLQCSDKDIMRAVGLYLNDIWTADLEKRRE